MNNCVTVERDFSPIGEWKWGYLSGYVRRCVPV
jgi:hypothetical protein